MVKYTLHYFDARGRGECARLLLAYGEEDFVDKRYTQEEFKEAKKSMPFGQVPVLEVDGKMLPQSFTINRYLARKYGLAGKDDFEQATVDAIGDSVMDFFNEFREWFLVAHGFAPGDKDKIFKEKYVPAAEKYFPIIKKYIKDAGNGYLVKGGPTWVDFHFAEFFDTLNNLIPDFYKTYPEFKKLSEQVHALPKLQKYLNARSKLEF
uniref:glutathione transferase n=1 Tax=Acrobeloides nanus TaxID=290746 RepID=A0A914DRK2_9BILA